MSELVLVGALLMLFGCVLAIHGNQYPGRKHRGSTREERANRGNNVTSTRGNKAIYTLKRLKR